MAELTVNLGFKEHTQPLFRILCSLHDTGIKYPGYEDILSQCVKIAGSSYHKDDLEHYISELSFHFKDDVSYVYNDIAQIVKRLVGTIRARYMQMGWLDDEGACLFRYNGVWYQYDILVWRG